MHMLNVPTVLIFSLFLISSCDLLEYSPNSAELPDELKDLTIRNIALIKMQEEKDTLRIAVTGDSQRYYYDAVDLVNSINQMDGIDFLIHTGDFTDFGLNREFVWMAETFNALDVPWLVAVGNHDLVGNGPEIYEGMFGTQDFFFDHGKFRFLFYDSNGRESGFASNVPDIAWINGKASDELTLITVCHVPPYSQDFNQNLIEPYFNALENNVDVKLALHGHHHDYGAGEFEGTTINYINSMSCSKREFILLEVSETHVFHEKIPF